MTHIILGGPGATSDVLAGTRWRIASIDGTPVLDDEVLRVDFGHDGRVSGHTGVNQFTASYSVTAEYLTFGPMATTRRMGPPELVEQETKVIQSLAGMCPYRLSGDGLEVDGPMGWVHLATTMPSPVPPSTPESADGRAPADQAP